MFFVDAFPFLCRACSVASVLRFVLDSTSSFLAVDFLLPPLFVAVAVLFLSRVEEKKDEFSLYLRRLTSASATVSIHMIFFR